MERRRIRKPHENENTPIEALPLLGTYCSVCLEQGLREIQRQSDGGPTCKFGHGGAEGVDMEKVSRDSIAAEKAKTEEVRARASAPEDSAGFVAREGDVLVVHYTGAKLQIAPYTTVEVDSAIYTRRLEPGDDPKVEFDRVYNFVRNQCINRARAKLATFSDELAKAKKRAAGGEG